jgi:hypothetical protein
LNPLCQVLFIKISKSLHPIAHTFKTYSHHSGVFKYPLKVTKKLQKQTSLFFKRVLVYTPRLKFKAEEECINGKLEELGPLGKPKYSICNIPIRKIHLKKESLIYNTYMLTLL